MVCISSVPSFYHYSGSQFGDMSLITLLAVFISTETDFSLFYIFARSFFYLLNHSPCLLHIWMIFHATAVLLIAKLLNPWSIDDVKLCIMLLQQNLDDTWTDWLLVIQQKMINSNNHGHASCTKPYYSQAGLWFCKSHGLHQSLNMTVFWCRSQYR